MLSAYPFELSVLRAHVRYWAGDVKGYIDALAGLVVGCKAKARAEGRTVRELKEMRAAGQEGRNAESRADTGEKLGNEDEDGESGEDNEEAQEDEKANEGHQADLETLGANDELDDTLATAEANLFM